MCSLSWVLYGTDSTSVEFYKVSSRWASKLFVFWSANSVHRGTHINHELFGLKYWSISFSCQKFECIQKLGLYFHCDKHSSEVSPDRLTSCFYLFPFAGKGFKRSRFCLPYTQNGELSCHSYPADLCFVESLGWGSTSQLRILDANSRASKLSIWYWKEQDVQQGTYDCEETKKLRVVCDLWWHGWDVFVPFQYSLLIEEILQSKNSSLLLLWDFLEGWWAVLLKCFSVVPQANSLIPGARDDRSCVEELTARLNWERLLWKGHNLQLGLCVPRKEPCIWLYWDPKFSNYGQRTMSTLSRLPCCVLCVWSRQNDLHRCLELLIAMTHIWLLGQSGSSRHLSSLHQLGKHFP